MTLRVTLNYPPEKINSIFTKSEQRCKIMEKEIKIEGHPEIKPGFRGKFFHPKTIGVMHSGTVKKVLGPDRVRVHFDIDDKIYVTYSNYNPV